jgi:hypothetical protein
MHVLLSVGCVDFINNADELSTAMLAACQLDSNNAVLGTAQELM